ncbi:MAG: prolipoprotein diacylglyceryl transferase, partial [Mycobacterium gordonae]|nr:prolipoprotein diacylglyceryl transferase [Mycobacterium gordonae]
MTTRFLAYIPSPPRGVWHLGPLPIRAYAFFIITGIIVALLIGDRRWAARGGQRGVIYDIALWMVPFGLIGGRLYHLATDWQTYWGPGGAGLSAALRIWDGGLGIWGAVALGVVGAWIGCRRHGVPLPAFIDAVAPGVVLAQAIGRLGNYFNQELYGRETTMPWGLEIFYRRDPAGYVDVHSLDGVSTGQVALVVQPTFLYELLWNLLVFGLLLLLDRRFVLGHGRLFASYVALYCVGRFGVELLRDDTATHIAGIRINTFTSTFVFIGAVVYIILAPKGREDPALLRGRGAGEADEVAEPEPEEELAAVAAAGATTAAAPAGAGGGDEPVETAEADGGDEPAPVTDGEPEAESEPEVTEAEAAVAEAVEGDVGEVEEGPDGEVAEAAEEAEETDVVAVDLEPELADETEATELAEAEEREGAEPDVQSDLTTAEPATDAVEEAGPDEADIEAAPAAELEEAESEVAEAELAEETAESAEAEPVAEDPSTAAKASGHPLLGAGPAATEAVGEPQEATAAAEPELVEVQAAEADEVEAIDEAVEAADETDEAAETDETAEAAEAAQAVEAAEVEATDETDEAAEVEATDETDEAAEAETDEAAEADEIDEAVEVETDEAAEVQATDETDEA